MRADQMEQFKQEMSTHLEDVIKKTVNGKIDKIDKKLDEYIVEDKEWKVRAEPVVEAFENSKWSIKIVVSIVKFLALLVPASAGALWIKKLLQ